MLYKSLQELKNSITAQSCRYAMQWIHNAIHDNIKMYHFFNIIYFIISLVSIVQICMSRIYVYVYTFSKLEEIALISFNQIERKKFFFNFFYRDISDEQSATSYGTWFFG